MIWVYFSSFCGLEGVNECYSLDGVLHLCLYFHAAMKVCVDGFIIYIIYSIGSWKRVEVRVSSYIALKHIFFIFIHGGKRGTRDFCE